ncbi:uncharacterized protein A1O9_06324, partial [Exophiala aquamarina CBS 119918]
MLSLCCFVGLLAFSFPVTYAYVDFGTETIIISSYFHPTPIPHQLPTDLRQELHPSMITAVSPAVTIAANGTREMLYSLHYHDLFKRTRQGRGIFKRGVFANDPPISTCKPCGGSGSGDGASSPSTTTSSCVTKTYLGVFQYPDPADPTSYCYDSNYSGVFKPSSTITGLPCCFTFPESCLRNATSTTSSSFTFSSGVFRPTSSSTFSSGSSSPTTAVITTQTTSYSIVVISSTTITITPTIWSDEFSTTRGTTTAQSTITVITATPSTISTSASFPVTVAPNTIIGCGTASGRGHVNGSGTVYFGSYSSVVSSGTASGAAIKVVGCGTLIATTGGFNGTATIIGCGYGSGTGDITGTGTVWPAQFGGSVSFVTSGTVHNVTGAFSGCGTVTGTGGFEATEGPTITLTSTTSRRAVSATTIEVYVSYCPDPAPAGGIMRLGQNFSLSGTGSYPGANRHSFNINDSDSTSSTTNSTSSSDDGNAICTTCPNSVGICCPPNVPCNEDDGKCPQFAIELSSQTINGYLIAQLMNSTAPVAGRKKVRALPRKK